MSIPTSRATRPADVVIDDQLCTVCGICVDVCKGGPLYIENHRLHVDQKIGFGCIACAACVAACPVDAIRVSGRDLYPEDVTRIPPVNARVAYEQVYNLLLARRSTRNYTTREVDAETIQKILDAASTAPIGIPPSDVGILVFRSRQAVEDLRFTLLKVMATWRVMFNPLMTTLMRPFMGKEDATMFRNFIGPAIESYIEKDREGIDWFFYNAPLAFYFYGTPYNDPGDMTVAATLAMLAGESLGLGTCLLGFPGYVFRYSKAVREKYALPKKIQPGLMLIMGYPKYRLHNAVHRRFREVREYQ